MKQAESFLQALDRNAKLLAPSAWANYNANRELCSWLLNPLACWATAAYGESAFDDAARGYAKYCIGVARAQKVYEAAGKYTPESMPEIISAVYEDEGYNVPYMWAAILIYAFWPSMSNHLAMFRDQFLRRLPPNANVLELASGHGILSLLAAQERPDIRVQGVDISPPAVDVSNRLLAVSGLSQRVNFQVKDALAHNCSGNGVYQGVISAMLAEHLPDPKPLFTAMSRHVSQEGRVFFSTAVESPQRDHVFEYNFESQPLQMAEAAGLRVMSLVSDTGGGPAGARFKPRAVAMILQRR